MKLDLSDLSIGDLITMYAWHKEQFLNGDRASEHKQICDTVYPEYVKRVKALTGVQLFCKIKT